MQVFLFQLHYFFKFAWPNFICLSGQTSCTDSATHLPVKLCHLSAITGASCWQICQPPQQIPPPGSFICLNEVGILFDNDHALQDTGEGQILVRGKLCPVAHAQQHWRCVRLKSCDCFGPARLHQVEVRQLRTAHIFRPQISWPSFSITVGSCKTSSSVHVCAST